MGVTTEEQQADGDVPVGEDVHFEDFDLCDEVLDGVRASGYENPTPVQVATIPAVLEGAEVVVQAQTGTGKTAAFGLPLLELLDDTYDRVQAVVLTPTRELAQQVASEIENLGQCCDIEAVALYGGDPLPRQVKLLEQGPHVVVGTPGRILDHLRRRTLKVRDVEYLVLDEADEMLSMGFARELNAILRFLPDDRKTMLFSATFPGAIERLIDRHVKDPVRICLSSDKEVADSVEHHYYVCSATEKPEYIVAVLDQERIDSAIVFCNRRDETRLVANVLRRAGYHALPINSDLSQSERDEVMATIKRKELRVLVATDIAARGIDISKLSHVVNYSVPESPDTYVHRSGRTGRVGRKGTAVTLVSGQELSALRQAEGIRGIHLEERRLPSSEEIMETRVKRLLEDLQELAELRTPEEKIRGDRTEFLEVAESIQDDEELRPVVYMLLQSFFEGVSKNVSRKTGEDVESFARDHSPRARSGDRPRRRRRPTRGR
ncbi:MAG: DEAD/DEAH box helicase [Acidobacteriota bacterium]